SSVVSICGVILLPNSMSAAATTTLLDAMPAWRDTQPLAYAAAPLKAAAPARRPARPVQVLATARPDCVEVVQNGARALSCF
ncbi:MAG: hypothetical protein ABIT83_23200, partial [Massilia sp.]